jgi:hypothetical protein
MKIYDISLHAYKFERESIVPISSNSILKWFGFSEEGMMFSQDNKGKIRCYNFHADEWTTVLASEIKD